MTKEEAKSLLAEAAELVKNSQYLQAHTMLTEIDKVFPNSGRVTQQIALCLIGMGRLEEADAACKRMEQMSGGNLSEVRDLLAAARRMSAASGTTPPAATTPSAANEFFVESVNPVSEQETCVTGHVLRGAFFTGSMVSITTPDGLPLLAPVTRLATQNTPINVVREGPLAAMTLKIEPQYIVVGNKITSSDSGAAFAPTMIVDTGADAGKSDAAPTDRTPQFQDVLRLISQRAFAQARDVLDGILASDAKNLEANRLIARVYLEADGELQDNAKALEHVMRAYEFGGHDDPAVLDVLAFALGANGRPEHGLRHLERLYETAVDPLAKENCAKRIAAYRGRFKMPSLWQFFDGFGAMILESSDLEQIRKAIVNKSIPRDAVCRKNKIGSMQPIQDSIALESPEIADLFKAPSKSYTLLDTLIGALAGVIVGIVFGMVLHVLEPIVGLIAGGVAGTVVGAIAGILHTHAAAAKH
ncbi:MAG: hypothetical protein NTU83_04635 [Candidatus Hydrogenedentes bacterium]|nr:hypothetical protein [Candidatus Hydrogenedentota bacterium]